MKRLLLMIVPLVVTACASQTPQTPTSTTYILEENPVACASRSIRGNERDPCTTYKLICYPNRYGTCLRANQQ